jgi:hypothetical protein
MPPEPEYAVAHYVRFRSIEFGRCEDDDQPAAIVELELEDSADPEVVTIAVRPRDARPLASALVEFLEAIGALPQKPLNIH